MSSSHDSHVETSCPHGEGQVIVLDGLHVEADGRDGGHDLTASGEN